MALRLRARKVPTLPLILGLTDGILNALTLDGGAILRGNANGLNLMLALRVGIAALVTAAFTMFVADYAERRSRLIRSSRELSLTEPGRLAASNLGREIARESTEAAIVAGAASLVGAAGPLLFSTFLPLPPWATLGIRIGFLGLLGWKIARSLVAGRWSLVAGRQSPEVVHRHAPWKSTGKHRRSSTGNYLRIVITTQDHPLKENSLERESERQMQRIVKWSPRETSDAGWSSPRSDHGWLATDLDAGHTQSFDFTPANLAANPGLTEAFSFEDKIGSIREMSHEVRDGQRIFIFLLDFAD